MTNTVTIKAFKQWHGACGRCKLPIGKLEAEYAVALAETRMRKDSAHHRLKAIEIQLESLEFNLREPLWGVQLIGDTNVMFCAVCLAKNAVADFPLTG